MNKNFITKVIVLTYFIFISSLSIAQDVDYIYPMGINENDVEELKAMPQKAVLTRSFYDAVNLPNSFSLKQFAPIPKRQKYGTCSAWASAYAARTIIEAKANNWTDKEEITKNAFTPAFTYRISEPDVKDCNGAATSSVVASLKTIGALPLKSWNKDINKRMEYYCPDELSKDLLDVASNYKINDFSKLFYSEIKDSTKTEKVKLSLSNGNPVVITMLCPISFHRVKKPFWEPVEKPNFDKKHGRHAMTVVGYDNNKYGGAFEVQNSWGVDYADGGYVWIKYEDFNTFVYGAIELFEYQEPEPERPLFKGALSILDINSQIKLKAKLTTNNPAITYKIMEPLVSGSRIRFYLQNDNPAYVYVLGTGSVDPTVNILFPVDGLSALLNYNTNVVPLPSEDHHFEMDDTVGKDYVILLYSKEKLDIDLILKSLNDSEGTIDRKLDNLFEDQIISNTMINYNESEIDFETYAKDQSKIMSIIIEFDHN